MRLRLVPGIVHRENPINLAISNINHLHIIHRPLDMVQWGIIRLVGIVIMVQIMQKNRKIVVILWQQAWVSST